MFWKKKGKREYGGKENGWILGCSPRLAGRGNIEEEKTKGGSHTESYNPACAQKSGKRISIAFYQFDPLDKGMILMVE